MALKQAPALHYGQGRSRHWGGSKLVNCFAEMGGLDKREQIAVVCIPGATEWADIGTGPIRGTHYFGGVLYVVSGTTLYSVTSAGVETSIGTIVGTAPVSMADNGTQLCIATGSTGYVYSSGSLTAPLAYSVSTVSYIDGYIVWTVADSDQFFISALDDALTYDAADIGVVEGSPDELVGAFVLQRDMLFFGETSLEIYYNSGNPDFPFQRQGNAFIERGCFDRNSIVKLDNTAYFVGDDRVVYLIDGYRPQRISTHDIEYHLATATQAHAFGYVLEGHSFYCLELDEITLCYDAATQLWHQRQTYLQDIWRMNGAVVAYGNLYFTDGISGSLYSVSNDVFSEDGTAILMDVYPPVIELGRDRVAMYSYEAVFEMGVANDDVSDPQVMLRYTDNNGHTWSNEMWRSLGVAGGHATRAVWRGLGVFRQRQMHMRVSDAVRRLAISYYMELG